MESLEVRIVSLLKLGDSYLAIGKDIAQVRAQYDKALALANGQLECSKAPEDLATLTVVKERIGDILYLQGDFKRAKEQFLECLSVWETLVAENPWSLDWMRNVALIRGRIAKIFSRTGQNEVALGMLRTVAESTLALAKRDPQSVQRIRDSSNAHGDLGDALEANAQYSEALTAHKQALQILMNIPKESSEGLERNISIAWEHIGRCQRAMGQTTEALNSYTSAKKIRDELPRSHPKVPARLRDLIAICNLVADLLLETGRANESIQYLEQAFVLSREWNTVDVGFESLATWEAQRLKLNDARLHLK